MYTMFTLNVNFVTRLNFILSGVYKEYTDISIPITPA